MSEKQGKKREFNRRDFLKGTGILGAFAFAAPLFTDPLQQVLGNVWEDDPHGIGTFYENYTAGDVIYSTCEQCNTYCTIKTVLHPGRKGQVYSSLVRKIAGNPYSPLTTLPFDPLDYATPITAAAAGKATLALEGRGYRGGRTCLKGQAGIQTAYDVMRIRTPLKRVGPRGSEKWISISWEQAIDEIVNGSPDLGTPGLKSIWAFAPKEKVMGDWEKVKKGEMTQQEFDAEYKEVLIDTKYPDLGPKANQIACLGGNRRDFVRDRIWFQGFGSINFDDHGGACGVTSVTGNARSFATKQPKKRLYADLKHTEFVIAWGTNPLVANRGPVWLAPMLTNALARGMKLAVVDSRMSKTAEKADIWVPVEPGKDGALALGMGRWIVENKRYDERYLRNPNPKAAEADGEPTWSDAAYLVAVSNEKRPKLRASDLGLGSEEQFVVMENGKPVPHDQAADAELEVDTEINGIRVKSVFTLYKERVMERTLKEYAQITGVSEQQIVQLAKEFTSHGKRAAIMVFRGPAMHANGYYNARAINMLNHLIGNHDWKGGSITTGARHKDLTGRYDLITVPKADKAWGIPISRRQSDYEKSSLFKRDKGFPALRPWFPVSGSVSSEVIPSAGEGYPYPLKALFFYRISPVVTFPAGDITREILKDPRKIPLVVASDIVIGESSMYADYILPDLTYLERWGRKTITPSFPSMVTHFIQPVTRVFPEIRGVEDVFIEILKKMELPGAGENAFVDGSPLHRSEDFYLKMVANIAYDQTPVPDAGSEELRTFEEARQKGLGKSFALDQWKQAVKAEEWPKVVYVLNRGGRFEAPGKEYVGPHMKYKLNGQALFYDEMVAGKKHSFTGKYFDGLPKIEVVRSYDNDQISDKLPLTLINWKARNLGTHRGISNAWLREIKPENYLWMNPGDAVKRGLQNGDQVKIRSDSFEAAGRVMVTEGIRPGTVGTAFNFGHVAYGGKPVEIDQVWTKSVAGYGHTSFDFWKPMQEKSGFAKGRNTGFSVNQLLKLDPTLKNNTLLDPIGGGVAQLDTRVEVSKL